MKYTIHILLALFFVQSVFSQEHISTKKEVENMLIKAGDAIYNLECDKSLSFSKKALNEAHKMKNDVLMAKAYNLIGLNFEEFSDAEEAIIYYDKALVHANKVDNDSIKDWIYNNLGNVYTYRKINFQKGIEYYKKGLVYSIKIKDSSEITYTKLNIVSAYFAINKFKEGIDYLESSKTYIINKGELEAKISLYSLYGSY